MALQPIMMSFTVQDAKGSKKSLPVYGVYDDSTATLSGILAYFAATFGDLEDITEGFIVNASVQLFPTFPVGARTTAADNSDVEEGGLFTYVTSAPGGKAYSHEVPAFLQTEFVGKEIDTGAGTVAETWINRMITSGTVIHTNNLLTNTLNSLRHAKKSFRK